MTSARRTPPVRQATAASTVVMSAAAAATATDAGREAVQPFAVAACHTSVTGTTTNRPVSLIAVAARPSHDLARAVPAGAATQRANATPISTARTRPNGHARVNNDPGEVSLMIRYPAPATNPIPVVMPAW